MKNLFLALLSLLFLSCSAEETNYNIKIKINGLKNKKINLAHYTDGRVYAKDTIVLDSTGAGVFTGKKKLAGGMYIVYIPPKNFFDIIIGNDQSFTIEADTSDIYNSVRVSGADETEAFLAYKNFIDGKIAEKKAVAEEMKKAGKDKKKLDELRDEMDDLDKDVRKYIRKVSNKFSDSALSSFLNLTIKPEIPDFAKNPENLKDKKTADRFYRYNRNHYWDNINFSDSTLIRTPNFKIRLDEYFNKIIPPNPDSLFAELDKYIRKTGENKEMFRYMTSYAFNNTMNNNIMGMDAAWIKVAEKYYLSGKAYWIKDKQKREIEERYAKTRNNLVGMKAKPLKLPTIDGEWADLYETDAPVTMLVFWEHDCGHCKKQIPKIKKEILDKFKDKGLKVFAVYTLRDKKTWEDSVEKFGIYDFINCYDPHNQSNFRLNYNAFETPAIYLLDKDKKIIAKNLSIENYINIIEREFGIINIDVEI